MGYISEGSGTVISRPFVCRISYSVNLSGIYLFYIVIYFYFLFYYFRHIRYYFKASLDALFSRSAEPSEFPIETEARSAKFLSDVAPNAHSAGGCESRSWHILNYFIYGTHVPISDPKLQPEYFKCIVTIVTYHLTTCRHFVLSFITHKAIANLRQPSWTHAFIRLR